MYKGIDISQWQDNVDYDKVKKQGVEFAIIRCGYGKDNDQKDKMFEKHYEGLKRVGIKVGCYLYSYCDNINNAILEAENCLEFIKGKDFELPVFYDLEDKTTRGLGKNNITKIAKIFCERIEKEGYKAGIYANLDWFTNFIDIKEVENYYIWLAQWTEKHTANFRVDFWQYTNNGKVLGINNPLDENDTTDLDYQYTEINSDVKKSLEELANEVIDGKWGNGEDRRIKLTESGYNYDIVQNLVNEKMSQNKEIVYIVKPGDNLTTIAKKFNTTVDKIASDNNIKNKNLIYINQKLIIK